MNEPIEFFKKKQIGAKGRTLYIIRICSGALLLLFATMLYFNEWEAPGQPAAKVYLGMFTFPKELFYKSLAGVMFFTGCLVIFPYHLIRLYLFDTYDYSENKTDRELILKLRLRATLFNNISVLIVFVILIIVIIGFWAYPKHEITETKTAILKIGGAALLTILIQILFKTYKFLTRTASQYNEKADAYEYNLIHKKDIPDSYIFFKMENDISKK